MANDRKGVLGLGVADKVTARVKEAKEKGGPLGILGNKRR